jgi:hypothetical protein
VEKPACRHRKGLARIKRVGNPSGTQGLCFNQQSPCLAWMGEMSGRGPEDGVGSYGIPEWGTWKL